MYYSNGSRNVKHVLNCWRRHSAHTPHTMVSWSKQGPMCSSQMLVSMDGQEYSLNLTKRLMSQPSWPPMWVHHRRRQWFITLSCTSVDFSEEVSWTGLPLQWKPMLSTCLSESSAFTSPMLMSSSEVIISHWRSSWDKTVWTLKSTTGLWNSNHLKFEYIWGIKNTLTDTSVDC